jgi:hypothetical protein
MVVDVEGPFLFYFNLFSLLLGVFVCLHVKCVSRLQFNWATLLSWFCDGTIS